MNIEKEIEAMTVGKFIKYAIIALAVITLLSVVGSFFGLFSEAATVAKQEFGAKASLKKYEWFKDASAQIKKLDSDINVYVVKQDTMCNGDMDRLAREQCMLWSQEVAGIKSAYNDVVAEYNAQSKKFNWSFYNVDNLPVSYKGK